MTHPIELVTTDETLKKSVMHLQTKPEIAIDLEFDKNYYRYGFNLCLVQIFTGELCYLIDPLSDELKIETLFPVLENRKIQKVCFSFDEDLRLLHSLGCFPKNLYDIGTASRLLNYPSTSLTNLLIDELGIDPGKSSQQSNWFKRPLSERQKSYAANDVLHLLKLKDHINQKAVIKGVQDWIVEENRSLDELDYSDLDHNQTIKEKDKQDLTEREWHLFKKLMHWRDSIAKEYKKPPFQIVSNKILTNIAKDSRTLMDWEQMRGVFRMIQNNRIKQDLIDIIKEGSAEADEMNLSDEISAKKSLSREEHKKMMAQKTEISRAKKHLFDPLKEKIKDEYGEETASFLLSNRIVEEIVTGEYGGLHSYKKTLFQSYAADLNLDTEELSKYL
jgi:ribonuclease D